MDYAIRHLAKLWKEKLATDEEFIRPADFSGTGMPDALRQQIDRLIRRQLVDSMPPPATEWADLDQPEIRDAWDRLVSSASDHIRCPASYLTTILETAISELLELVLQPRVALPHALFGRSETLDSAAIRAAADGIGVQAHLTYALIRYMEIKEIPELTREACADLIARIDEKLVSRYSPSDFVDLLAPLFDLYGGEADPSLMGIFFEEKGRADIAHELDQIRSTLDAEQLTSLLEHGQITATIGDAAGSILDAYVTGDDLPPAPAEEDGGWGEALPPEDHPEPVQAEEPGLPEPDVALEIDLSPEALEHDGGEASEAVPFWRQFMSADEADSDVDESDSEVCMDVDTDADPDPDTGSVADSGVDPDAGSGPDHVTPETSRQQELDRWLAPARERFIEEVFGGSEEGFDQALLDLSGMDTWRQAATYIQREIFARNMVDLYSEAAIDFTDSLQSFFQDMRLDG